MDYASNSHKARDERSKPEKPEIVKVVTGEVVEKPKSTWRKFKDIFLGGDMKTSARFVVADVILPDLRNLLWDSISRGSERIIFGEGRRARRSTDYRPSRTVYNATPLWQEPSREIVARPRRPMLPDQPPGGFRPERYDRNEIILASRSDAENVVEELLDTIQKYQVVTLADLYDMLGRPSAHTDNRWGWTYLNNVEIRQISSGYLIDLPQPEPI